MGCETMTRKDIVKFIRETDGKIFSIKFIKRSTGKERQMVARTGVKKHLKGGEASYDFKEHDLISVFDMQANEYRSIPIEGITEIKIDGDWVKVEVQHDKSLTPVVPRSTPSSV